MHPRQAGIIRQANHAMDITRVAKVDPWKVTAEEPVAGAGAEFQKVNPKITDEEVKVIDEEHEKNKDSFKAAADDCQSCEECSCQKGQDKTAATVLWKHKDDEGKESYLPAKKTTVKSPYSGKSVSGVKPEKLNMGDVTKELKNDAKKPKTASVEYRVSSAEAFKTATFSDHTEALRWADTLIQKEGTNVEIRWNA